MGVEGAGAEGADEGGVVVVFVEGWSGVGGDEGEIAEGGEVLGSVGGDVGERLEI